MNNFINIYKRIKQIYICIEYCLHVSLSMYSSAKAFWLLHIKIKVNILYTWCVTGFVRQDFCRFHVHF